MGIWLSEKGTAYGNSYRPESCLHDTEGHESILLSVVVEYFVISWADICGIYGLIKHLFVYLGSGGSKLLRDALWEI